MGSFQFWSLFSFLNFNSFFCFCFAYLGFSPDSFIFQRDWFHKKTLHRTTRVFSLLFPGSFFHFCPSTWDFPEERQELLEEARTRNTCYILKPNGGSQGEGISLFYASRLDVSFIIPFLLPFLLSFFLTLSLPLHIHINSKS